VRRDEQIAIVGDDAHRGNAGIDNQHGSPGPIPVARPDRRLRDAKLSKEQRSCDVMHWRRCEDQDIAVHKQYYTAFLEILRGMTISQDRSAELRL
jgi:hypothetical protein